MSAMYSQYFEEVHIAAAVADVPAERRRFLDIGAWEPCVFSNSRALYEAGWSGVVVDPSPSAIMKLIEAYGKEPRVEIVSLAVAAVEGGYGSIVELQATDDCVSTTDADFHAKMKATTNYYGRIFVQAVPVDHVVKRFWGEYGFAFINIDAEAQSVPVFLRTLELDIGARCICVEHDGKMAQVCEAATGVGYELTYSNGVNAVFRRKQ